MKFHSKQDVGWLVWQVGELYFKCELLYLEQHFQAIKKQLSVVFTVTVQL